jgi:sporulation protein YlmC with PRC-barrel domain
MVDDDFDYDHHDPDLSVSGALNFPLGGESAVDVRRGMVILTSEGHEAGRVAGVIIDRAGQHVTHILLTHLGQLPEYRLVPVALVDEVHEEMVRLSILRPVVNTLPIWQSA